MVIMVYINYDTVSIIGAACVAQAEGPSWQVKIVVCHSIGILLDGSHTTCRNGSTSHFAIFFYSLCSGEFDGLHLALITNSER